MLLKHLFLLFVTTFSVSYLAAQDANPEKEPERIDVLIDLLYSVEDYQTRFINALDNDPTFQAYTDDQYFIAKVTEEVKLSALSRYGAYVSESLEMLSPAEVDSLIAVLESPFGAVIKKAFVADNAVVEKGVVTYVNELMAYGVSLMELRDSLLFEKVFPYDLSLVMNGEYLDEIALGKTVRIIRTKTAQQELFEGETFKFDLEWINNSKYSLTNSGKSVLDLGRDAVVNIYEIEGDEYRYIWKNQDGTYYKGYLTRTSFGTYEDEINVFRWALNDNYANEYASPLPAEAAANFMDSGGHDFYPVADKYRINATFVPSASDEQVTMETSNGSEVTYRVYGKAVFKLDGQAAELSLYQSINEEDGPLFLPFQDETSGLTTYGGGRYIDIKKPAGGAIVIDFNKSYNPYCAYTDGYACPVPPAENRLKVSIEAGIKMRK